MPQARWLLLSILVLGSTNCGGGATRGQMPDDHGDVFSDAEGPADVTEDAGLDPAWLDRPVPDISENFDGLDVAEDNEDADLLEAGEAWSCASDEDCVEPVGPCEVASCVAGKCVVEPLAEGSPCETDGNPCTKDQCNGQGECVHLPILCLDPPQATCEGSTLVTYSLPGQCVDGECVYQKSQKHCDQGCVIEAGIAQCVTVDPCKGISCDEPPSLCFKAPGTCVDGVCIYEYNDSVPCDDGNPCTLEDHCEKGVCLGTPLECVNPPSPYCSDSMTLVTFPSTGYCTGGVCIYQEVTVQCTQGCGVGLDGVATCIGEDLCANVDCSLPPSPCFKAPGECVGGVCIFGFADGAPCEDGDLCTLGDYCEAGICKTGFQKDCDDKNPCTDDSCDPETGLCIFEPNSMPCDDGRGCTTQDMCKDGLCKGIPVICDSPPAPTCEDFLHVKIFESPGFCEERLGICIYRHYIVECTDGVCQYGFCIGTGGVTLLGSFVSAGTNVAGEAQNVTAIFGGWTEAKEGSSPSFLLSVGF